MKTNPKSQDLLFILDKVSVGPSWFENCDETQLKTVLEEALEFLNEYQYSMSLCCNQNINTKVPLLSGRQFLLSQLVMEYLTKEQLKDAYHELWDCVEDYGRGRMYNAEINPNEYVIYKSLITFFLVVINKREKQSSEILSNWKESLDINKHEHFSDAPSHNNFRHRIVSHMNQYELSFENVIEEIKRVYNVQYTKEDIVQIVDGSYIRPDIVWVLADLFGFDVKSIHQGYLKFDEKCPNINVINSIMMKHIRGY